MANKNKTSWKVKAACGAVLFGSSWLGSYGHNQKWHEIILDPFLEVPQEVSLEKRIQKPVHFLISDDGQKRAEFARLFGSKYDAVKNHWDNFEQQFAYVDRIHINITGDGISYVDKFGKLTIATFSDTTLVHELAHIWHGNMNFLDHLEFNRKWLEISENHYTKEPTEEDILKNGAVSRYALTNILEDVAETTKLVYNLNNPAHHVFGFPNTKAPHFLHEFPTTYFFDGSTISKDSLQKVIEKVLLLNEYDFISDREYVHVIKELGEFHGRKYSIANLVFPTEK
jgi:hypothetical protein